MYILPKQVAPISTENVEQNNYSDWEFDCKGEVKSFISKISEVIEWQISKDIEYGCLGVNIKGNAILEVSILGTQYIFCLEDLLMSACQADFFEGEGESTDDLLQKYAGMLRRVADEIDPLE